MKWKIHWWPLCLLGLHDEVVARFIFNKGTGEKFPYVIVCQRRGCKYSAICILPASFPSEPEDWYTKAACEESE